MKELVAATGLPKSTILLYVEKGLLPRPVKTSPNMAYYAPECIERLALIKSLQNRHSLPLKQIKKLLDLKDQGQDITPMIELSEVIFGESESRSMDEAAFCSATGLGPEQVRELEQAQLLLPLEEGRFDRQDVILGTIYAEGESMGLELSDITFYPRLGKKIVDEEMSLRQRLTTHLPHDQDAARTTQLVQSARAMRSYVIDRLFQRRVAASRHLKDEKMLSEPE